MKDRVGARGFSGRRTHVQAGVVQDEILDPNELMTLDHERVDDLVEAGRIMPICLPRRVGAGPK